MKTYCQPVFVAPFGNVTSISVVGFHVEVAFAHIPPSTKKSWTFRKNLMQNHESTGKSMLPPMSMSWPAAGPNVSVATEPLTAAGLERAESGLNFMRRSSSSWSDFFRRPSSTFGLSHMSSTFSRMSSTFSRPTSSFMVPAGVDLTPTIGRTPSVAMGGPAAGVDFTVTVGRSASVAVGGPAVGGDLGTTCPQFAAPERVASTWVERTASVTTGWAERTLGGGGVGAGWDRTPSSWPQRVASVVPSVPVWGQVPQAATYIEPDMWGQVPQGTTQINVDQAIARLWPLELATPCAPTPFRASNNDHEGGGWEVKEEQAKRPPLVVEYAHGTQDKRGQPPLKRGNSAKNITKNKRGKKSEDKSLYYSDMRSDARASLSLSLSLVRARALSLFHTCSPFARAETHTYALAQAHVQSCACVECVSTRTHAHKHSNSRLHICLEALTFSAHLTTPTAR